MPLPHGAARLDDGDYYAKARQFRRWLVDSRGLHLDEMSREHAREYFGKFRRRWNDGVLDAPPQELSPESKREHARITRREERRAQREWADENAPKATGRDALIEKRRGNNASNRAFAERRDDDDLVSEDVLMGGQDDFAAAYAHTNPRLAARDRADAARSARQSAMDQDKQARLAARRSKEDATIEMLRGLARERFS
ncbi:hypothetical protein MCUN1_003815 [Malassezia cuniculi]|uniref:Uncharacterized protein n=1 Tax=Malassezia cuniculi TaxID=948313 RepID=A0AAF0F2A8_9BASI|nr:hypothetical protein MCUN1_003815 [Malassezia cuniculi]